MAEIRYALKNLQKVRIKKIWVLFEGIEAKRWWLI